MKAAREFSLAGECYMIVQVGLDKITYFDVILSLTDCGQVI